MQTEQIIRLSIFGSLLVVLLLWEYVFPSRGQVLPRKTRWPINFGLSVINSTMLAILPITAVGVALYAQQQQWGFFNQFPLPDFLVIIICVVALDLVIYWQHRIFHRVNFLWRLHVVHHSDGSLDVSSALRFHPVEILLSLCIKGFFIALLGVPVIAVVIFEVLLNGMAMFNHCNVSLPKKVEDILRFLVVTPDMHRIHHSQKNKEMNSNYGFNLSLWDKIFSSYSANASVENFALGIKNITEEQKHFLKVALLPLHYKNTGE
jgi:sterol desaturase/sphingolipid hydroxylase (fatty acid hydroxylase superfamily)